MTQQRKALGLPHSRNGDAMKVCTWVCPDDDTLTDADKQALAEWIRAHGLNPEDYYEAAVLTDELHLTEVVRDEKGWPVVDYAANQIVTRPKVVPLMAQPPIASATSHSPEYVVSDEDARRYRPVIEDAFSQRHGA